MKKSYNILFSFKETKFIILFFLISSLFALDLGYIELEASFKKPLYLTSHVNNPDILYVIEQRGIIWELNNGIKIETPFLDIRDKVHTPVFPGDERGLLGFAMSPNFQADNFIYVNYINNNDSTVISRFNGLL